MSQRDHAEHDLLAVGMGELPAAGKDSQDQDLGLALSWGAGGVVDLQRG